MKHDDHQKDKLIKKIIYEKQYAISQDIKERKKRENIDSLINKEMLDKGVAFYEAGYSLDDASLELRENRSFIYGYERAKKIQDNRQEIYDLGVQKFIDGVHLKDISEVYRNNQDFIQGYMDAKAQSLIDNVEWQRIPDMLVEEIFAMEEEEIQSRKHR